jgi:hypothetical protein
MTVVLAGKTSYASDTVNLLKTIAGELAYALHNVEAHSRNMKNA